MAYLQVLECSKGAKSSYLNLNIQIIEIWHGFRLLVRIRVTYCDDF